MSMLPLRELIEGQVGTPPASRTGRTFRAAGSRGLAVSWPTVLAVVLLSVLLLLGPKTAVTLANAYESVRQLALAGGTTGTPEPDRALVITANPKRRLSIVTTLSPRGLQPLLAQTGDEIRAAIAAHPSHIRLVVLDGGLPGSGEMAASLRRSLPGGRLIVLQPSMDPAAIGSTLLDRL